MKRFTLSTGKRLTKALAVSAAGIGVLASSFSFAALLGIMPGTPRFLINSSSGSATTYSSNTLRFSVAADPVNYFPPGFQFVENSTSAGPKSMTININVNNDGTLRGGVPLDDLVVIGAVDTTGDNVLNADGVLLTGEIIAFGFLNGGTTDTYDFRFVATGGLLAPLYANQDIGFVLTSENSNFNNSFFTSFQGKAKGNLGPIPGTPRVDIEKFTNGQGADDPNGGNADGDAPLVTPGGLVTWEYIVTTRVPSP